MEKDYKIYMYENKTDHKKYVGQTKNSLKERAGSTGHRYARCRHFYNAIKKYGFDNFTVTILKDNLTLEEANYWEDYYIQKYDLKNPDKGYNINDGGNSVSEEQREKIAEMRRQEWINGKHDFWKRAVYCVEMDREFDTIKDGAETFNLNPSTISQVCQGKIHYCGIINGKPLHWIYLEDKTEEKINELKNRKEILSSVKVYSPELDMYFSSYSEAARYVGLKDTKTIRKSCQESFRTGGKHPETKEPLHWQIVE